MFRKPYISGSRMFILIVHRPLMDRLWNAEYEINASHLSGASGTHINTYRQTDGIPRTILLYSRELKTYKSLKILRSISITNITFLHSTVSRRVRKWVWPGIKLRLLWVRVLITVSIVVNFRAQRDMELVVSTPFRALTSEVRGLRLVEAIGLFWDSYIVRLNQLYWPKRKRLLG